MGGAETFVKRLLWACEHSVNYFNDDHGAEGYLNFTNEPSFHIPWLFCTDEIKRPDLAAEVIDRVIKRFSLPNDYPGDEDNGGMSSYYIFLMCGIFPYATTENYYLHGTRVEEITFNLGNGNKLSVTGENVGEGNIYVQSATWNGEALNECKLTHSQLTEGGELHFVMGDKPSDWARA
jgi:putative alpha-1,2-mannosidase